MKRKFRKNGYEYEEVCSNEAGKLFIQKYHGKFVAYEVIKEGHAPEADKSHNQKFRFPGNEAFGYSAWCYKHLCQAISKLVQLRDFFLQKQYIN